MKKLLPLSSQFSLHRPVARTTGRTSRQYQIRTQASPAISFSIRCSGRSSVPNNPAAQPCPHFMATTSPLKYARLVQRDYPAGSVLALVTWQQKEDTAGLARTFPAKWFPSSCASGGILTRNRLFFINATRITTAKVPPPMTRRQRLAPRSPRTARSSHA